MNDIRCRGTGTDSSVRFRLPYIQTSPTLLHDHAVAIHSRFKKGKTLVQLQNDGTIAGICGTSLDASVSRRNGQTTY